MSGLLRQIFVILLLIGGAGEIVISSEGIIQYIVEVFTLDELNEKVKGIQNAEH